MGCEFSRKQPKENFALPNNFTPRPDKVDFAYPFKHSTLCDLRAHYTVTPVQLQQWLATPLSQALQLIDAQGIATTHTHSLPGAINFDFKLHVKDTRSEDHWMLPSETEFIRCMKELKIRRNVTTVVFDGGKQFEATRVWWMLHTYGHCDVRFLQGGLAAWTAAGGATVVFSSEGSSTTTQGQQKGDFGYKFNPTCYKTLQQMIDVTNRPYQELETRAQEITLTPSAQIIDVRPFLEFRGINAQQKGNLLTTTHLPRAINFEWKNMFQKEGLFLSPQEIRTNAERSGIQLENERSEIVVYCVRGVTSTVSYLGMLLCNGKAGLANYDGSWSQWHTRVFSAEA